MNWLFETLNLEPPQLSESLLDCTACRVDKSLSRSEEYTAETKCCLFKPYWSSLAIGYLAQKIDVLKILEPIRERLIFLPVGIVHTLEERKDYSLFREGKLKSVDPCAFYNTDKRHCNIWQSRPATCSSFFCTSQYENGPSFYTDYESFTMGLESELVREWFFMAGYDEDDWLSFVSYFDEDTEDELPNHLNIQSLEEALRLYKDCYEKVKERGAPFLPAYYILMDQHRRL